MVPDVKESAKQKSESEDAGAHPDNNGEQTSEPSKINDDVAKSPDTQPVAENPQANGDFASADKIPQVSVSNMKTNEPVTGIIPGEAQESIPTERDPSVISK